MIKREGKPKTGKDIERGNTYEPLMYVIDRENWVGTLLTNGRNLKNKFVRKNN